MTWNEGDVNVQTDASNLDQDAGYTDTTTKGVLEIVEDVKDVLYTEHIFDRLMGDSKRSRNLLSSVCQTGACYTN